MYFLRIFCFKVVFQQTPGTSMLPKAFQNVALESSTISTNGCYVNRFIIKPGERHSIDTVTR